MSEILRLRRGTTAEHSTFTGAEAELTYDSDKRIPVIHDGVTVGGKPLSPALDVNGFPTVRGDGVLKIEAVTMSQYEAISIPDPLTLYVIVPNRIVLHPGTLFYFGNNLPVMSG